MEGSSQVQDLLVIGAWFTEHVWAVITVIPMMPRVKHNQGHCAEELILSVAKGNYHVQSPTFCFMITFKNLTSCKRIKKMNSREETGQ